LLIVLRAPIPADEVKRLALLAACKIIYTPAEQAFDDVARLAADLCGTEIALITLVDSDYQWFKARVGIELVGLPRDLSFCGHCINGRHPMVVEDTLADARFADNPLVTGDPRIRFYAGVPLEIEGGSAVGALSVADRSPRTLIERQLESLRRLAKQISRELRLRRDMEKARAATPLPDTLIVPGTLIGGRWRMGRELGRGAVGVVYEAHDPHGQRAAVKFLLPEWRARDEVLERFAREARVLMRLDTPHVGRLLEVGNLDAGLGGVPYLVLEYLEGKDFGDVLLDAGHVPFRQAFRWCADACDGVAQAHAVGVVHRDIKPSNVFLADAGASEPVVKVLDFGLAAGDPSPENATKLTGDYVIGSPAYMSPEQMVASSSVDPRSDIWSMGTVLYELLTGQLPFTGATPLEMFAAAMTRSPIPLRARFEGQLPPDVEEVVGRCLQKDRADRIPSMRALAGELRAIAAGA
jgi:serine/threonine-protein kinase